MHLLKIRNALLTLALLLAALLVSGTGAAQDSGSDEPGQEPQVEDTPAVDQGESEPPPDEQSSTDETLPDVRRLPPRTDEEERQYKLFKAQNDPFLLDQLNGALRESPGDFYDPLRFIKPVEQNDFTSYIVQDDSGRVLGHLEVSVRLEQNSGLFQLDMMNELDPPTMTTVVATAAEMDALTTSQSLIRQIPGTAQPPMASAQQGVSPQQGLPSTIVEYNFDRITVRHRRGGVESHVRLRELPFSFDRNLLLLLVRQVDYENIAWPFEAVVMDTAALRSLPLALDKPERETVMSAEPANYTCFRARLRIGSETSTWWVEQTGPQRLVKFELGGLTYTLDRYSRQ